MTTPITWIRSSWPLVTRRTAAAREHNAYLLGIDAGTLGLAEGHGTLLTVADAARSLGLKPYPLLTLINDGRLRSTHVDGVRLVASGDVQRLRAELLNEMA